MKKVIHKADTRGHSQYDWLDSYHTFSFDEYFDSNRINFGALRVLNDDKVAPGEGFQTHPHKNMEIVSIPLKGHLQHGDSKKNSRIITVGEIQTMSAGTGIFHSEMNASPVEPVEFLQIWIMPRERNTLISTRSGGSKCPYCSGYIFSKGFNDLQTTHPEIASEWSEKNLLLKPDEANAKSRKNVWWRCSKCGNEWKSVINARVKGTVCPVCAEREVLAGYNDLATTDSQLLSEWDYEQNRIQPTEVSRTSAKRAWWKCRHGHSWSMKINERTILGKGCRICEQEYLSVFPAFALSYYSHMKGLKIELGSDRVLGIPLDTYIPSEQVAIEVNSGSEDMEILKEHLCQQRGIKRIKLPMKTNETEIAYAQRIKAAFQSVHIFITSDTEEDVGTIRNVFENWRNSQ